MKNTVTPSDKLLYTVSEVASVLAISRKTVYRLIQRNHLKACSALRHKLIPVTEVTGFIARTTECQGVVR